MTVIQQIVAYQISSFPYLVSINSVLPAIIAGNAVLLKPSPQTPLTAERFAVALRRAGVPPGVIQVVHLSPQLTNHAINNPSVAFVSFTGSVSGGRSVAKTASNGDGFTGVALEVQSLALIGYSMLTFFQLGGKDPAYVRPDADLDYTVAELVDGGSSF
jgi:acyl-CoA reductase-like NAD-dependent aldehyde dehydrogenase